VRLSESSRVGLTGLLALIATYALGRQAFGLFVPTFRDEFGLSLDVLGYYASGAQAGYLVATVATGIATARYGPRVPVVAGCLLLTFGAATIATATGPGWLAVGVIAAGTSAGGAWAPFSDAIAYKVPTEQTRRSLSLVNAGSPVGLVVASGVVLVAGTQWRLVWWAFAAFGLVAAAASHRVLTPDEGPRVRGHKRPRLSWFVNPRSLRMLTVALGISITCGAYFAYAPVTVQDAGLGSWSGPAMWASLGIAGAAVGAFGGTIANNWGVRRPLAVMLVLISGSLLMLLLWPQYGAVAVGSAALFGIGFTTGFALLVMWSQHVYRDRPTTGFTLAIVFIATGFIVGPSLFGVVAATAGSDVALLVAATPALLVALIPPAPEYRLKPTRRYLRAQASSSRRRTRATSR
jgi:predicted MFS family arabinose efflux permease